MSMATVHLLPHTCTAHRRETQSILAALGEMLPGGRVWSNPPSHEAWQIVSSWRKGCVRPQVFSAEARLHFDSVRALSCLLPPIPGSKPVT